MISLTEAHEGVTNLLAGVYKSQETEVCTMAPNICDFAVSNLLYVSVYGAYKFEVMPRFLERLCTPALFKLCSRSFWELTEHIDLAIGLDDWDSTPDNSKGLFFYHHAV